MTGESKSFLASYRARMARKLLRQGSVESPKVSLKSFLASAPLDDIDLERTPDFGRDVDL